jgi:hypothetical protein
LLHTLSDFHAFSPSGPSGSSFSCGWGCVDAGRHRRSLEHEEHEVSEGLKVGVACCTHFLIFTPSALRSFKFQLPCGWGRVDAGRHRRSLEHEEHEVIEGLKVGVVCCTHF